MYKQMKKTGPAFSNETDSSTASPLLDESARHQLLFELNETRTVELDDVCAHQLFEAQVERTPDAVAVVHEAEQLTFHQLNERSNQLAHHLQSLGVGPEVLVGLFVERSVQMLIGMLGILKAGGAYVPLDPVYPSERLAFALEDAGIKLLLTQQHLAASVPVSKIEVLCLDSGWEAIARQPLKNVESAVTAENLAYVIYTSGSTGRPKGVMLQHSGLCNLALAQALAFNVRAESRVLQFSSISFDASVSEIFKTLIAGATLHLVPQNSLMVGPDLGRLLLEQEISIVTLPPSVLATLPPMALPNLHTLVAAGEPCSTELISRWSVGRLFLNAYGPTETTVCATIARCESDLARTHVGRPMTNVQVYILNEHLDPVSVGAAGEIYVGGLGVARGYLNRPELTAERFVPHPFGAEPGARLYRTGDVACYLPDGNIEFLGRADNQVKVRGFRIELGEIEEVLRQHPLVRDSVVIAREDKTGSKRLVAYVVPHAPAQAACEESQGEFARSVVRESRGFLKERLPEYMVPASFVVLEALPLMPSGKVNRLELLEIDEVQHEVEEHRVAPRTELERLLAGIWREVLGLDTLGVDDNFFNLGGDSLRAAALLNGLQEKLGEYIYIVALFDAPTIASLAQYLGQHHAEAVVRVCGIDSLSREEQARRANSQKEKVDAGKVDQLRRAIKALQPVAGALPVKSRNPQAIFILSPPRSGSTLLRVMLAGNPALFSPPELQLLSFNTLEERRSIFSGRYGFWLEGTIRAIMDIKKCDGEKARELMERCEAQHQTVQEFYAQMQRWVAPQILVDKTPAYTFDLETLKRAEAYFENALYIHLLRHPRAMIRSFEEAKMDQIFRYENSFSARHLAEILWVISHQNILEFLKEVPAQRQHLMRFEQMVKEPRVVTEALCRFLCIDFEEAMVQPHKDKEKRMTDGIHGLSRMLGDIKFHTHQGIDAGAAERWKEEQAKTALGDITWQVAESLGYENTDRPEDAVKEMSGLSAVKVLPPIAPLPRRSQTSR